MPFLPTRYSCLFAIPSPPFALPTPCYHYTFHASRLLLPAIPAADSRPSLVPLSAVPSSSSFSTYLSPMPASLPSPTYLPSLPLHTIYVYRFSPSPYQPLPTSLLLSCHITSHDSISLLCYFWILPYVPTTYHYYKNRTFVDEQNK